MKRAFLVSIAVAALLTSGAAVAGATETDTPDCGAAMSSLADAKIAASAPAAALKALVDAQVLLDKAVVDAKAALAANVDPDKVGELTVAVTVAEQKAAAGKALVDEATTKNTAAVKVVTDAQAVVTEACTGADGTNAPTPPTVAPTSSPVPTPIVVVRQVPVYPSVAPDTGGGQA